MLIILTPSPKNKEEHMDKTDKRIEQTDEQLKAELREVILTLTPDEKAELYQFILEMKLGEGAAQNG